MYEPDQHASTEDMEALAVQKAQELFQVCDKEQKGFINKKDMQRLQTELALDPDQLEAVFDSLDDDGNGFLTLEEFIEGFGSYLGFKSTDVRETHQEDENVYEGVDDGTDEVLFKEMLHNVGASKLYDDEKAIQGLWARLRKEDSDMASNFEDFLYKVSNDIRKSKVDFETLESALKSKSLAHDEEVRKLYEEMELQIKQEKERILTEEQLKEQQIKEAMEAEMKEKDRQLQDLLLKHQEMEEKLSKLNMAESETKQENEKLQKEKEDLQIMLQKSEEGLEESKSYIDQLRNQSKDEKRERARAALKVTEGIALERESLVKQLDSLRDINQQLRDDKDEAETRREDLSGSSLSEDLHQILETATRTQPSAAKRRDQLSKQGSILGNYFPTSRGQPSFRESVSEDNPDVEEDDDDDIEVDYDDDQEGQIRSSNFSELSNIVESRNSSFHQNGHYTESRKVNGSQGNTSEGDSDENSPNDMSSGRSRKVRKTKRRLPPGTEVIQSQRDSLTRSSIDSTSDGGGETSATDDRELDPKGQDDPGDSQTMATSELTSTVWENQVIESKENFVEKIENILEVKPKDTLVRKQVEKSEKFGVEVTKISDQSVESASSKLKPEVVESKELFIEKSEDILPSVKPGKEETLRETELLDHHVEKSEENNNVVSTTDVVEVKEKFMVEQRETTEAHIQGKPKKVEDVDLKSLPESEAMEDIVKTPEKEILESKERKSDRLKENLDEKITGKEYNTENVEGNSSEKVDVKTSDLEKSEKRKLKEEMIVSGNSSEEDSEIDSTLELNYKYSIKDEQVDISDLVRENIGVVGELGNDGKDMVRENIGVVGELGNDGKDMVRENIGVVGELGNDGKDMVKKNINMEATEKQSESRDVNVKEEAATLQTVDRKQSCLDVQGDREMEVSHTQLTGSRQIVTEDDGSQKNKMAPVSKLEQDSDKAEFVEQIGAEGKQGTVENKDESNIGTEETQTAVGRLDEKIHSSTGQLTDVNGKTPDLKQGGEEKNAEIKDISGSMQKEENKGLEELIITANQKFDTKDETDQVTVNQPSRETSTTDTANQLSEKTTDTANQLSEKTTDTANQLSEKTTDTANQLSEKTTDIANQLSEKTRDTANQLSEKTTDTANQLSEKTTDTANQLSEKTTDTANQLSEKTTDTTNQLSEKTDTVEHVHVEKVDGATVLSKKTTDATKQVLEKTDSHSLEQTAETAYPLPEQTADIPIQVSENQINTTNQLSDVKSIRGAVKPETDVAVDNAKTRAVRLDSIGEEAASQKHVEYISDTETRDDETHKQITTNGEELVEHSEGKTSEDVQVYHKTGGAKNKRRKSESDATLTEETSKKLKNGEESSPADFQNKMAVQVDLQSKDNLQSSDIVSKDPETSVSLTNETSATVARDLQTSTPIVDLLTSTPAAKDLLTSTPAAKDLLTSTPAAKDLLTSTPAAKGILTSTPAAKDLLTSTPAATDLLTSTPAAKDLLTSTPAAKDLLTSTPATEDLQDPVAKENQNSITVAKEIPTDETVTKESQISVTVAKETPTDKTVAKENQTSTAVAKEILTDETDAKESQTSVTITKEILTDETVAKENQISVNVAKEIQASIPADVESTEVDENIQSVQTMQDLHTAIEVERDDHSLVDVIKARPSNSQEVDNNFSQEVATTLNSVGISKGLQSIADVQSPVEETLDLKSEDSIEIITEKSVKVSGDGQSPEFKSEEAVDSTSSSSTTVAKTGTHNTVVDLKANRESEKVLKNAEATRTSAYKDLKEFLDSVPESCEIATDLKKVDDQLPAATESEVVMKTTQHTDPTESQTPTVKINQLNGDTKINRNIDTENNSLEATDGKIVSCLEIRGTDKELSEVGEQGPSGQEMTDTPKAGEEEKTIKSTDDNASIDTPVKDQQGKAEVASLKMKPDGDADAENADNEDDTFSTTMIIYTNKFEGCDEQMRMEETREALESTVLSYPEPKYYSFMPYNKSKHLYGTLTTSGLQGRSPSGRDLSSQAMFRSPRLTAKTNGVFDGSLSSRVNSIPEECHGKVVDRKGNKSVHFQDSDGTIYKPPHTLASHETTDESALNKETSVQGIMSAESRFQGTMSKESSVQGVMSKESGIQSSLSNEPNVESISRNLHVIKQGKEEDITPDTSHLSETKVEIMSEEKPSVAPEKTKKKSIFSSLSYILPSVPFARGIIVDTWEGEEVTFRGELGDILDDDDEKEADSGATSKEQVAFCSLTSVCMSLLLCQLCMYILPGAACVISYTQGYYNILYTDLSNNLPFYIYCGLTSCMEVILLLITLSCNCALIFLICVHEIWNGQITLTDDFKLKSVKYGTNVLINFRLM